MIGFNVQEDVFPLGLSYLKNYAAKFHPDVEFEIKEFGIGNRFDYDTNKNIELQTMSYILLKKPDLVCFSCYIWSGNLIKNLCTALKKVSDIKIAVGGVEANPSFKECSDYLILGEGEIKFKEIIDSLKGEPFIESEKYVENLDDIPFPYRNWSGKKEFVVARIETTRGCPYNCKYCYYAA
ncbi:cobalamin-dependent protein [Nanoarchaeota archaeon]